MGKHRKCVQMANIFWAVEHSATQSWVVTLPEAGVVPAELCWASPERGTVAALLRHEEGCDLHLVLKQENKLTYGKWRKNVALKEIMMQPDYHKVLAECVISSIAGHFHCHCQSLRDLCRDTKSAPAVRYNSSPEKVHNRFLITLI